MHSWAHVSAHGLFFIVVTFCMKSVVNICVRDKQTLSDKKRYMIANIKSAINKEYDKFLGLITFILQKE